MVMKDDLSDQKSIFNIINCLSLICLDLNLEKLVKFKKKNEKQILIDVLRLTKKEWRNCWNENTAKWKWNNAKWIY